MDPRLWQLYEQGDGADEVPVVLRLGKAGALPEGVRPVAQFGEIATARLPRAAILAVRGQPETASMKAAEPLAPEPDIDPADLPENLPESRVGSDERRPDVGLPTGRGVVLGVVDWGLDFAHPDFRRDDGSTRLLALWDQGARYDLGRPNRYGYGAIHSAAAIDQALAEADPYAALGYHPGDSDPTGRGAHGTHVMSIAAGNGRSGGPVGIAPEAGLVFVQLVTGGPEGAAPLGDSVTLLEAVDFIAQTAGNRPWVINLSMGRHGGQHDGTTLVEQAFDALLKAAPGRGLVQSTGNYYNRRIHSADQLRPGEKRTLIWETDENDVTTNELEIWYSGRDVMRVVVRSPNGQAEQEAALGERASIEEDGRRLGVIYHRANEPNTLDHQIVIVLEPDAPAGDWEVTLFAKDVVDGRFHAWIERDAVCPGCQSRFRAADAVPATTTGTICNGYRTIAVGAYNAHSPGRELARFSSSGPTRDGRLKPDLLAPGVAVLAARSARRGAEGTTPLLMRTSGTSMAAPHVAGAVALMFAAAPRRLRIEETHSLLLGSAQHAEVPPALTSRVGSGYLDIGAAVEAARRIAPQIQLSPAESDGRNLMHSEQDGRDSVGLAPEGPGAEYEPADEAALAAEWPADPDGDGAVELVVPEWPEDEVDLAAEWPAETEDELVGSLAPVDPYDDEEWLNTETPAGSIGSLNQPGSQLPISEFSHPQSAENLYAGAAWANDADSPDYRHLGVPGLRQEFDFSAVQLERLCRLNRFDVTTARDEVLFGLRGCMLVGGESSGGFVTSVRLSEDMPDHNDFHCVLGVWKRSTGRIVVFKGSTVPNWSLMDRYRRGERDAEGNPIRCNMLPTGRYIVSVGTHRGYLRGALRQTSSWVVLRTQDDLFYTVRDLWEAGSVGDNIHPAFYDTRRTGPFFSSAGCQTIPGNFRRGRHTGLWADFRQAAGLSPNAPPSEDGRRYVYVLLTGREARLAATGAADRDLARLRFGSSGPDVAALQLGLRRAGYNPGSIDQDLGPTTAMAYIRWQQARDRGAADAIVTPALARRLGFDMLAGRSLVTAGEEDEAALAAEWPAEAAEALEGMAEYGLPGRGADLVQLAEVALPALRGVREPAALLDAVLSAAGVAEGLHPLGGPAGSLSAVEIFDAFTRPEAAALRHHLEQYLAVIARPGERLQDFLHEGDVVVRSALGEGHAHLCLVAEPEIRSHYDIVASGFAAEGVLPGWYTIVVEGGVRPHYAAAGFARRVAAANGQLAADTLVLRPKLPVLV